MHACQFHGCDVVVAEPKKDVYEEVSQSYKVYLWPMGFPSREEMKSEF
jgi:hypothetical protein